MRECKSCFILKNTDEFTFDSRCKVGTCKSCQNEKRSARVKNNPEINKKRRIEASELNKTPKGKYLQLIHSLRQNKIYYNFTLEDYLLLSDKSCDYCKGERHSICPRVISDGYIVGNLQPVCSSCKKSKLWSETEDAFQRKMIRKYGITPEKQEELNLMIGSTFGNLTVESIGDKARGHFHLNCRCSCGKPKIARQSLLLSGKVSSCGCLSKRVFKNTTVRKKKLMETSLQYFNKLKSTARGRNIINTLTYEEYLPLFNADCFYCGGINETKGMDRVDNSKGYESGNVVSCCRICNSMKNTLSYDDFISHMQKIIAHRN